MRKYYSLGYAIDRHVDGVESRFGCSPLLYYDYRPVPEFRGYGTKLLLRKNMTLSFEDTEQKET